MKFYNTISRKKEEFRPIVSGKISLYTCGPTVYDYAHIGNLRAFLFEDLLRRYLEFLEYDVLHIMNITDIDDKTIRRSREEGRSLLDFTNEFSDAFFEDLKSLNIVFAHHYPRATEFVDKMVNVIKILEERGYTYTTEDGSVFYKISQFPDYGRLARLNPDQLISGERVAEDEYGKEEGRDFALWKGYKPEDGDVFWDSPWGRGRPGWHIECSVMSTHYLGDTFDIHCGGVDNIFPHHENEIAQSCAASGQKFVHYWLHNEHLLVDGQKMSKSLGNFYTLRDLIDRGYNLDAIRYTLISTHYRSKLNFTFDKIKNSQKSINKLRELHRRLSLVPSDKGRESNFTDSNKMLNNFSARLGDDLNISGALGELFIWVNEVFAKLDKNDISFGEAQEAVIVLERVDSVLGVINSSKKETILSDDIRQLIDQRNVARDNKDWGAADQIRDKIYELGFVIEDTPEGTIWKKK